MGLIMESSAHVQTCEYLNGREDQVLSMTVPVFDEKNGRSLSLPSVVPIGAPWQQIYLLARRQQKIYVEVFDVAPIKLTLRWICYSSWWGCTCNILYISYSITWANHYDKFLLHSFSSSPWMLRNGPLTSGESLIHVSSVLFLEMVSRYDINFLQAQIEQGYSMFTASVELWDVMNMICTRKVG